MSDNEIGDEGVEGLARALRLNTSIRLLELCFNRITAAGTEVLAKSIWGTTGLRALRLDNNQVGTVVCRHLAFSVVGWSCGQLCTIKPLVPLVCDIVVIAFFFSVAEP